VACQLIPEMVIQADEKGRMLPGFQVRDALNQLVSESRCLGVAQVIQLRIRQTVERVLLS